MQDLRDDKNVRLRQPLFVDSHVHLAQTGLTLGGLDLSGTRSRQEVLSLLESFASGNSDAVILGAGWDESRWEDPTPPTGAEVDRAAPGRMVFLSRVDGHSGLVSSAVLDREPSLTTTPGWDGTGRVERDACRLARNVTDALVTRAQRKAAIALALDTAAAVGIGSVHEMAAPHINAAEDIELIRELAVERAQIEVVPYWGEHVSRGGVTRAVSLGCAGAAGDLNIDGAFGSRTAGLRSPYADRPSHLGHVYLDADAVAEHVIACTREGIQAGFHCIGDAGTAAAAEGFRLASKTLGLEALRPMRHRLEHVELIEASDFAILADCQVVMSVQPAFDAFWGGSIGMYASRLGVSRALAANPFAGLHRSGLILAFGSDTPVTPFDPWGAVRAAVHHHNPASRLSVGEALAAQTEAGRWAARQPVPDVARNFAEFEVPGGLDASGLPVLEPGTPLPRCVRTVVDGRTVYAEPGMEVGTS